MIKLQCPLCANEHFQLIIDLRESTYLPKEPTIQEYVKVNQYACTECGYVYHIVDKDSLSKVKEFHDKK